MNETQNSAVATGGNNTHQLNLTLLRFILLLLFGVPLISGVTLAQTGGPNDAPPAAACAACGAGMAAMIFIPIVIIALNIALLIWVARDAKARGMDSA
ncbi:MAG TPA: hypothetical protein VIK28_10050, partial [Sedimentisphaerales bacterium]